MSERSMSLGRLAELVAGRVHGDPAMAIHGAAVLREVTAGEITLIDHVDRLRQLATTQASAVVVPEKLAESFLGGTSAAGLAAIIVADAHAAFAMIVLHFRPARMTAPTGISPQAMISSTARCGVGVSIHPGATIGDECVIGDNTTIYPGAHVLPGCTIGRDVSIGPGAILYENTIVGNRTIIHGGAVLGAFGFGYSQADGRHILSAQLGYVRIGDDVEVGAGTTIDRGTYGATTIGDGTKIDNLVQIAHNCLIGRHNLICAQVGIAGSTSTGDYVVMGGQAGIRDHVHIGSRAILSAMAGVTNDIPDGAVMMGIPATPEREQKLKQAAWAKLPEMRQQFKAMRRAIAELEKSIVSAPPARHDSEAA